MNASLRSWLIAVAVAATATAAAAKKQMLSFLPALDRAGWTVARFPGIAPTQFSVGRDGTLEIASDSAAGLLWHRVPAMAQHASAATWLWRVDEGVAATDLTKKGGDDRALVIFFLFGDSDGASADPVMLLGGSSTSIVGYVFGGNKPRGTVSESPHMARRGSFIILRAADTPKHRWFSETVDLAEDYARIFNKPRPGLRAVAIGSDSDDTHGRNRAAFKCLTFLGESLFDDRHQLSPPHKQPAESRQCQIQ